MTQHTHALINSAILFILLATLGFAQKDSTEDIIAAEYCMKKDSTLEILLVKEYFPLVIQPQNKCFRPGHAFFMRYNPIKDFDTIQFMGMSGASSGCSGKDVKGKWRKFKSKMHSFSIHDNIKLPIIAKEKFLKDLDKNISELSGKPLPVEWNLEFSCDGKYVYELEGKHNVRVSGICTEEQLKKIEENLQYPVNPENPVNRGSDNGQK